MKQENYIDYGNQQFDRFKNHLKEFANRDVTPNETLLEYGTGRGEFLYVANSALLDAYGVDVSYKQYEDFKLHCSERELLSKYQIYDGKILPFDDGFFDYVYSFYVLEHVQELSHSLMEIVRVLKKGGIVALYAQDARTGYEGHAKTPYPPFLPREFIRPFLHEWGGVDLSVIDCVENESFYITAPQIVAILEYFGMEIVHYIPSISALKPHHESLQIRNIENLKEVVSYLKSLRAEGRWEMAVPDIKIYARKNW